jgi:hypothetical protein
MENLLKPITIKTLISRLYNYPLWGRLYIFPNKNLCDIKYSMENFIREKTNVTRQGNPRFHIQEESLSCHQYLMIE